MQDEKHYLTSHFALDEFTRSGKAIQYGIDNTPGIEEISNLQNLCTEVLDPLREHYGKAIHVNSGYRCPKLNEVVGGSANSQHMKGEAADLFLPSVKIGSEWHQWIQENCKNYDQLILERNSKGGWWLHVSCCRDIRMNRHQHFEIIKPMEKNKG